MGLFTKKKNNTCQVCVKTPNHVVELCATLRGESYWAELHGHLAELLPFGKFGMSQSFMLEWKPLDDKSVEYFNKGE